MKVLFVSGARDLPTDGVQDYVGCLGAELVAKGHRVSSVRGSFRMSALLRLSGAIGEWKPQVGVLQFTHLAWSRRGFPFRAAIIASLWDRSRYSPLVTVIHDPTPFSGAGLVPVLRAFSQQWVMRSLVRHSDAVVVTVEPELFPWISSLSSDIRRKVLHVPVGSNVPSLQRVGKGDSTFAVVVFGITEGKTEIDAIAAVARGVANRIGKMRIVLVGRGTRGAEPRLRERLAGAAVEVICLGVLPATAVAQAISSTDVSLFLRGAASTRHGSLIAAIGNGLPVVGYEGAETGPLIRKAGILMCREGDTRAAIGHLLTLASDSDMRKRLSERNRELYESIFSWSSIASSFEQIFDNAASQ